MTLAPPTMLYYLAYTHPNTPTPVATPANSHVTRPLNHLQALNLDIIILDGEGLLDTLTIHLRY